MILHKVQINGVLIFLIFLLSFVGFYAILLLVINAGMSESTRLVTIPVRILIGASLLALIVINLKKVKVIKEMKWFLVFTFLYIGRVVTDYYLGQSYYLSTTEVLFYFLSFAVIPFVAISTFNLKENSLSVIYNALFFSGFLFSVLAIMFYQGFIGQVGRLTTSIVGEEVISPLALSYSSALIIGVVAFYLIFNRPTMWRKLTGIILIGLSTVPFFLGGSRGALIALFSPFLLLFLTRLNLKFIFKGVVLMIVLTIGLVYLDESLGSGLLNRFLGISSAINEGSSSASRIEIWKASFNQFLNFPILGDKLDVEYFASHPHNLFLEVLQTTGVIGFSVFLFLVYSAFRICFYTFRKHPQYSWISVIFIQAFAQNMFSGAIHSAAWFWTSMALVFSLELFLKNRTYRHIL